MGNTQASNSQYSNIYQPRETSNNPYLTRNDGNLAYQPRETTSNPYLTSSVGNLRYYDKTGSDGRYQSKGDYWINNSPQITVGNTLNPGKINLQTASNISWIIEPSSDSNAICFKQSGSTSASICLSNKGTIYSSLALDTLISDGKLSTIDNISLSDTIFNINGTNTDSILTKTFNFSSQPVTVSCWFKLNNTTTGNAGIIFGNFGLNNPFNLMFSGNNLRFIWLSNAGSTDYTFANTFLNNIWYHIVVIKLSPSTIQLYINNINQGSFSTTTSSGTINLSEYKIGRDARDPNTAEGFFKGSIYGLLSYSKILTDIEISSIYNFQKSLQNF
jgi:hypothetical protein